MKILNLIAILALASVAFSYLPAQYSEKGLNYTEQRISIGEDYTYIIQIRGEETLIIGTDGKLVDTPDEIYQILRLNVRAVSGYDTASVQTIKLIEKLEDRRSRVESECYRLTGMDKYECNDRESCVLAAFSTPIASMAVNADGFWESMLKYKNDNNQIRTNLEEIDYVLGLNDSSRQTSDKIIQLMNTVANAEENIEDNSLVLTIYDDGCQYDGYRDCFNYCPKLNWTEDKPYFDSNKSNWNLVSAKLATILEQDSRAAQIYKKTEEWKYYLENRADRLSRAKNSASNVDAQINQVLSSKEYRIINASQISVQYAKWSIEVSDARKLGDDGQFYNAINTLNKLEEDGKEILAQAKEPLEKFEQIKDKTKNIRLTLDRIKKTNQTGATLIELETKYSQLNESISTSVQPQELESILSSANELEGETLVLYAKSQLDISIEQPVQNETPKLVQNQTQKPVEQPVEKKSELQTLVEQILAAIKSFFGI